MTDTNPRPVYVVTLRPEAGVDAVRALRLALKWLLRTHGLRCVGLSAAPPRPAPRPTPHTQEIATHDP
jgi:hypothetical protein